MFARKAPSPSFPLRIQTLAFAEAGFAEAGFAEA